MLGFSRGSILISFFFESVLLADRAACWAACWCFRLNGVTTGLIELHHFSEMAFDFRVRPEAMAVGSRVRADHGSDRGAVPGAMAANKEILVALREV